MSRKSKSPKKPILSDKITDLLTLKPAADIEDDLVFDSKPKTLKRDDLGSSDSDDAAISDFRKQNTNLLSDVSKKYEGEVSGRLADYDDSLASDEDAEQSGFKLAVDSESDKSESDKQSNDSSDDVESEEGFDLRQLDIEKGDDFIHMQEENVSDEVNKGNSVRNQLLLWESLLEMRINFQKCLITANKMPLTESFKRLKREAGDEFTKKVAVTENAVKGLLDKMLDLQNVLMKNYPETKNLTLKSDSKSSDSKTAAADDDEEIPSDSEPESNHEEVSVKPVPSKVPVKRKLQEYSQEIAKRHADYRTYRDSVIQKWNDKTRLAITNSKSAPPNPILSQINYILSGKNRLIRRTQLKRSEYKIVGYVSPEKDKSETGFKDKKDDDEYIADIFDDDDFYHQLLRELIECKTADISDPIQLGRQWVALQQMKSNMKRKVDTKATKGRRIKYVVHPKLVNFMAPEKNLMWSDESKTELFKSLFGKVFEESSSYAGNAVQDSGVKLLS